MVQLSGWGRYPVVDTHSVSPQNETKIAELLRNASVIARGNGRGYGDCAIGSDITIGMTRFNRFLNFDEVSGRLEVEAGVLLSDVIDVFLKRGWFPYVTPGTKFVTIGGMIAADVHGKNHHKDGGFGRYVDWIDLLTADNTVKRCSRSENSDLFRWTLGGMGLTGIILSAAIRLKPVTTGWIEQQTIVAQNLSHAIDIFERSRDATYSVAWIDCLSRGKSLGRSLVMLGEHIERHQLRGKKSLQPLQIPQKKKLSLPIDFPNWCLNKYSIRAFNELYYWKGKQRKEADIIDWDSFFYPLDSILSWNKIYGKRGFAQYQCVFPLDKSEQGLAELLSVISNAGMGSFLAVLKRLGEQSNNLSFPMPGYTLALDFPVNPETFKLMDKLDDITLKHGGRFYLAKDSRMARKVFLQSDKRVSEFISYRERMEGSSIFNSTQSERLGL